MICWYNSYCNAWMTRIISMIIQRDNKMYGLLGNLSSIIDSMLWRPSVPRTLSSANCSNSWDGEYCTTEQYHPCRDWHSFSFNSIHVAATPYLVQTRSSISGMVNCCASSGCVYGAHWPASLIRESHWRAVTVVKLSLLFDVQKELKEAAAWLVKIWANRMFFWWKGLSFRPVQVINTTSWRKEVASNAIVAHVQGALDTARRWKWSRRMQVVTSKCVSI